MASGRNKGVFDFNVVVDVKRAVQGLNSVNEAHQKAKVTAATEAGKSALSRGATELAKLAKVARWQIRGYPADDSGTKGSGARVGRSRYIKKIDGVKIYLRHAHINPLGTAKRKTNYTVRSPYTKTGKLKKNGGGVSVRGHKFDNAFIIKSGWQGAVYKRDAGGNLERQDINILQHAGAFEVKARSRYVEYFPKRWEKHFNHNKRQAIAGSKSRATRRAFARSLGR